MLWCSWYRLRRSGRRLGNGGYVDQHLRDLRFVLIDEAHTLYEGTTRWLASLPNSVAVIGLTATPFTKGLAKHYSAIVNVATADALFRSGTLVRPTVYVAAEMDTAAVAVKSTGEFDDAGLERAGIKIIGDVPAEYINRTHEHFGGPVKTIVFSSTVAHGEALCRALRRDRVELPEHQLSRQRRGAGTARSPNSGSRTVRSWGW
jgi:superfamily II DNA or RNA helicase